MRLKIILISIIALFMASCAAVPLKTAKESNMTKQFIKPSMDVSNLYVDRDSYLGASLKKDIWVNGKCVGESVAKVFFKKEVPGNNSYTISTESEFSPNDIVIDAKGGNNYFIRQYIKFGVFVGGTGLELVDEDKGIKDISTLELAENGTYSE